MSSASPSSAQTSAPTSRPSHDGKSGVPGEGVAAAGSPGGDAFLREQADEARAALARGLDDLKAAVAGTIDPRQLPRRYPIWTISGVAVAGFVAAVLTIPSREEQELKRLERIRRAMYPEPEPPKPPHAEAVAEKAAKASLWVTLLREAVQAARPMLVSLVTASLKAHQQERAEAAPPSGSDSPYGG
jgi:hypothetical protein